MDTNRNGRIDYADPDRINRTTSAFATKVWEGQLIPVATTTTEFSSQAAADTPLVVSIQERSVDGRHAWTTSFGASSHQKTLYPATRDGSWQVKSTAPDQTSTVTAYLFGRIHSTFQISNHGSQIREVTYSYDAQGREGATTAPTPYSVLLATRYDHHLLRRQPDGQRKSSVSGDRRAIPHHKELLERARSARAPPPPDASEDSHTYALGPARPPRKPIRSPTAMIRKVA